MADFFHSVRFFVAGGMLLMGIALLVGGLLYRPYAADSGYYVAVGAVLCLNSASWRCAPAAV